MGAMATAILFTIFVWWFSTGLVLLLVLRRPHRRRTAVIGAALLFPLCLAVLAETAALPGTLGVYVAFTATVALWGTQEIAFLSGFVTGPCPQPCPPGQSGFARFRSAVGAILYHEIALALTGAALVAVTWGAADQTAILTYGVLWVMRLSAKLNLFLGMPVLNDAMLPAPVAFLRSYFRRGPVNVFFPLALFGALALAGTLAVLAADPAAAPSLRTGLALIFALVALAILEHLFMLLPLRVERLWAWSTPAARLARAKNARVPLRTRS